ncbi:hypothetical protein BJ742DRAFT_333311 [Cladochytrium replicatum]|nr:hypothetical protein BJ742DRAFT_333311 [Cladochytrium replicatum]
MGDQNKILVGGLLAHLCLTSVPSHLLFHLLPLLLLLFYCLILHPFVPCTTSPFLLTAYNVPTFFSILPDLNFIKPLS